MPGPESLRQRQYYANKHNSFWKIMGELAAAPPHLPYEQRLAQLKKHGIALWDVCAAADRVGSLDSKIQMSTIEPNDFAAFFTAHKRIKLICFNGQPAERLFQRKVFAQLAPATTHMRREILPSTSPAHARLRFEDKLRQWRTVLQPFIQN